MSQHIVSAVATPNYGQVQVMVGYDPCLREFFGTALTSDEGACYHSESRQDLATIRSAIHEELGVELPQAIFAGAEQDQQDFQAGQKNVGRRIVTYDLAGSVIERVTW
jgi:hypothetical protein